MTRQAALPAALATLGAGALSALTLWLALVTPQPLSWAAAALTFMTGIWALAGGIAIARTLASFAPPAAREPEPAPPAPAWKVERQQIDKLSAMANPSPLDQQTLVIQAQETLSAEAPLTHEDLAWFLWRCYTLGNPSRKELVGHLLPSARRLTRLRYDETVQLLCAAGIIVDRKKRFAGRWAPGLTLTAALHAIDVDPESLPLERWQLGPAWPGLAKLGTSPRFLVGTVVEAGD